MVFTVHLGVLGLLNYLYASNGASNDYLILKVFLPRCVSHHREFRYTVVLVYTSPHTGRGSTDCISSDV